MKVVRSTGDTSSIQSMETRSSMRVASAQKQ
jgi:hypothetical protein